MIRDEAAFAALIADVRAFVRTVAMPAERGIAAADAMPEAIVDEMRRRGYFGWSIPEAYGGSGLTTEELSRANIELSQCAVVFRARVGMNTGIAAEGLVQDGSEALKARYLPRMDSGGITGCLALTEPEAGSDASALRTIATPIGPGRWRLDGRKRYITLAPIADVFTVMARTGAPDARGADAATAFLIERGTPGLSTSPQTPKMGQEGAPIGEVMLDGCEIDESQVIGTVDGGFRTVLKALNKQRINLAALSTGPAIRMLDEALAYAMEREQFGQPIAEFQLVQAMLADCKVEIEAARALILETARKRDRGEDVTLDVSMCKYLATEMCGRVADRVVQIFGGQGYVKERLIEQFYRDVRAFRIYEGTSQIHQLNIARLLIREARG